MLILEYLQYIGVCFWSLAFGSDVVTICGEVYVPNYLVHLEWHSWACPYHHQKIPGCMTFVEK